MNTEQVSENIFTFKACWLLFFNIRPYIYEFVTVFLFLKKLRNKLRKNIFTNINNSDDHNIILVQNLKKKLLYDQIFQTFSNPILFGIVSLVYA